MLAAAASLGKGNNTQMTNDLQTGQQHQSLVDDPEIWGSNAY